MIQLSRQHRIVRYAYIFDQDWAVPRQTSLCALFWRCMLNTVLFCLPVSLLVAYAVWWWRNPSDAAAATVASVGLIGFLVWVDWIERRRKARREAQIDAPAKPPSLVKETLGAIKDRVCPLVSIGD
jgi:hypothetical protein